MRVLKWIIERCEKGAGASESAIGHVPRPRDLDLNELPGVSAKQMETLLSVNAEEWRDELAGHGKFFDSLSGVVPDELQKQRKKLAERLS